jgi:hypothetical protein
MTYLLRLKLPINDEKYTIFCDVLTLKFWRRRAVGCKPSQPCSISGLTLVVRKCFLIARCEF